MTEEKTKFYERFTTVTRTSTNKQAPTTILFWLGNWRLERFEVKVTRGNERFVAWFSFQLYDLRNNYSARWLITRIDFAWHKYFAFNVCWNWKCPQLVTTSRHFFVFCGSMCCTSPHCLGIAQIQSWNSRASLVYRRMFCFFDNSHLPLGNCPAYGKLYQTRVTETNCKVGGKRGNVYLQFL